MEQPQEFMQTEGEAALMMLAFAVGIQGGAMEVRDPEAQLPRPIMEVQDARAVCAGCVATIRLWQVKQRETHVQVTHGTSCTLTREA